MFRVVIAFLTAAVLSPVILQAQTAPRPGGSQDAQVAFVVNLNTATSAELQRLPGIGVRTAERIIEFRTKNGPFKKIEELMNVQGIGEKTFLRLRPQLTVAAPQGPSSPR